jgi:hypothetical protein
LKVIGLAGIVVEPTEDLISYQKKLIDASGPAGFAGRAFTAGPLMLVVRRRANSFVSDDGAGSHLSDDL